MSELKLGLAQGYWGAAPKPDFVELAQEAERLGFDSVWSAEAWGNDAFTPLAWIGAQTEKIKLGTAVVQLSGRTPTSCAMHALTQRCNDGNTRMVCVISRQMASASCRGAPCLP